MSHRRDTEQQDESNHHGDGELARPAPPRDPRTPNQRTSSYKTATLVMLVWVSGECAPPPANRFALSVAAAQRRAAGPLVQPAAACLW